MGITVGIVGIEEAKFDDVVVLRSMARNWIKDIIIPQRGAWKDGAIFNDTHHTLWLGPSPTIDLVVSGGCHLGGIDIMAKELCEGHNVPFKEFLPKAQRWSGGYKERNLEIARASDVVFCITASEYPPTYKGMRFPYCYHCRKAAHSYSHVKSGGCWTVHQARAMGKYGIIWAL